MAFANRAQREEIDANKITVARDHEYRGDEYPPTRLGLERGDDLAELDIAQHVIKHDRGDAHDRDAHRDADPASPGAADDGLRKYTRWCQDEKNSGGRIAAAKSHWLVTGLLRLVIGAG